MKLQILYVSHDVAHLYGIVHLYGRKWSDAGWYSGQTWECMV